METASTSAAGAAPGALDGFRVLELSSVIMAPHATQVLGDLGAEVIKVETGGGDLNRVMGGGPHRELSGIALNVNRNKRAVSLNLKVPAGRAAFLRILDTCDVLVTNVRPGPLTRLGLSYQDVAPSRPRLVYCQAQGFRSGTGEEDRPAYDDIIQAATGLPRLSEVTVGQASFLPSVIADKVAGEMIVQAVLAALLYRERTGKGQRVEVPMFDAVLAFTLVEHLAQAAVPGGAAGYNRIMTRWRGPHRTRDGYVALMPYTDVHWRRLFAAVGRAELLDQPWYADHATRLANAGRVYAELAAIAAERTTGEWLELCAARGDPRQPRPVPGRDPGRRVAAPRHGAPRRSPGDRAVPADRPGHDPGRVAADGAAPGSAAFRAHRGGSRRGGLHRRGDQRDGGRRRRGSARNLMGTAEPDLVRAEVRGWVTRNWDPSLSLRDWRERLVDAGWAVPSWPVRWYGKGLPAWADDVVADEISRCGAVASIPAGLAGPTILEQGPDLVRERFLRPLLTGEETWCQLFSEPSAGSDIAGLTTTAVLDGDSWIVNGQKVWNTSAQHADLGMLLARTDWDVPKHAGITYLVLPMHQPGVEARPLRQMNKHSSFNEVFLTDARVPRDWVVGQVGHGWTAALATLAHERRFSRMGQPDLRGIDPGPALEQARAEAAETARVYSWYPQRAGRADLVIEHARSTGAAADPLVRQEIARLVTLHRVSQWTAERAKRARASGRPPGPGGIDRQARPEQRRPAGGPGPLDDRGRARAPRGRATRSARSAACWPRSPSPSRPSRSRAAPTRSSATSWANGCSACPASRTRPRGCRTARPATAERRSRTGFARSSIRTSSSPKGTRSLNEHRPDDPRSSRLRQPGLDALARAPDRRRRRDAELPLDLRRGRRAESQPRRPAPRPATRESPA